MWGSGVSFFLCVNVVLTTFTLAWNTPVAIAVLVFSSLHYLCLSVCLLLSELHLIDACPGFCMPYTRIAFM